MEALAHAFSCEQEEPLTSVIETPARTAAGRRAKAEVARTRVQLSSAGEPQSDDDALLWSLCDDLAASGSEASERGRGQQISVEHIHVMVVRNGCAAVRKPS
jgi:hypothetical protein